MNRILMALMACCAILMSVKNNLADTQVANNGAKIFYEWNFDAQKECDGWDAHQMTKPVVNEGVMKSTYTGADPFLNVLGLDFVPKQGQYVEIRMKSNGSGDGEFYFTGANEGPYNGFSPKMMDSWKIRHDGQWYVYRIYPTWTSQKKIIKVRIDFGNPTALLSNQSGLEIDYIRFIDLQFAKAPSIVPHWDTVGLKKDWTVTTESGTTTLASNIGAFEVDEFGTWLYFKVKLAPGTIIPVTSRATLRLWGSETKGIAEIQFPLKSTDFTYNFDLSGEAFWSGIVYKMELILPAEGIEVRELKIDESPSGPAWLDAVYSGMANAVNRTGAKVQYLLRLKNAGGTAIDNARFELVKEGDWSDVTLLDSSNFQGKPLVDNVIHSFEPQTQGDLSLTFIAKKAGIYQGKVKLTAGSWSGEVPLTLEITPATGLATASYVPKPIPVKSKYEIGALYFPGWSKRAAWDRIEVAEPIRKPVLGWYDESNPEVIDWQIKWAAETGIQFFLVDWYWNKGHQHHDHWIAGFRQASYRSYLQWAMMWANHNGPGSHSLEDTHAVTKFWIDNYFNMPEYYTIEGKPVVMIWSPQLMDSDIIDIEKKKGNNLQKGQGVKMILDLSRQMAIEAGYKGIYFVTMKWPEAATDPEVIQWLKDAGFDCTSIYHFMHHGGKAADPRKFSFDLVVDATLPYLEARQKTGILPFCPNISTSWDSRPWHGEKQTIIDDRTVEKFRRICLDVKGFVDKNKTGPIVLAPVNEWGEGSYIEPNLEFGFGMYEAFRETFCEKPADGFPPFFGPTDVGLGPYDLPPTEPVPFRSEWDFSDGTTQGWKSLMAMEGVEVKEGILRATTKGHDPALTVTFPRLKAKDWKQLVIRMKVTGLKNTNESAQLFWISTAGMTTEQASLRLPVINDGQFHDYVFDLDKTRYWRGLVSGFRFDPVSVADGVIELESVRLVKSRPLLQNE